MAKLLPPVPRFIFTILEPLSLLGGFLVPLLSNKYFISSQLVRPYAGFHDDTTRLLAWQLGNCYGLLGLLGVFILNTTTEVQVVKAYLWALWIGDIGHVGYSLTMMGWDEIMAVGNWSATIWGNTLFTVFLFSMRSLYFLGLFDKQTSKTPGRELRPRKAKTKAR